MDSEGPFGRDILATVPSVVEFRRRGPVLTSRPMKTARAAAVLGILFASACGERACGGRGGLPPAPLPMVKDPDGRMYYLLDKGEYKGYYGADGEIARVEYDSNKDGRADYIAHYGPNRRIRMIEVDEDYDAWVDRWEYYDAAGTLEKVGRWRRVKGKADIWRFPGKNGIPVRIEYDEDGDGRVDRAEVLEDGQTVKVEIDADRDGRMDRWQVWRKGRLASEDLDTKGTGKPDRRLVYGPAGKILRVERLTP